MQLPPLSDVSEYFLSSLGLDLLTFSFFSYLLFNFIVICFIFYISFFRKD